MENNYKLRLEGLAIRNRNATYKDFDELASIADEVVKIIEEDDNRKQHYKFAFKSVSEGAKKDKYNKSTRAGKLFEYYQGELKEELKGITFLFL